VPIYHTVDSEYRYLTGDRIPEEVADREVAFLAPDRQREGTVPVYRVFDTETERVTLTMERPSESEDVAFYALPLDTEDAPTTTETLYEIVEGPGVSYVTESALSDENVMTKKPVCLVWKKTTTFNPYKQ